MRLPCSLLALVAAVISQSATLYGPSQLHQYNRLLQSGNLGGLGQYQQAVAKGEIGGFAELEGRPKLAGLPPLPMTHDEVMAALTSTQPPSTTPSKSRPTKPTVPPPLAMAGGVYAVNPVPELPPMPERQNGHYDDNGEFVPDKVEKEEEKEEEKVEEKVEEKEVEEKPTPPEVVKEVKMVERNKIQGTKIRDFESESAPPASSVKREADLIEEYEIVGVAREAQSPAAVIDSEATDDLFYDDAELRVAKQKETKPKPTPVPAARLDNEPNEEEEKEEETRIPQVVEPVAARRDIGERTSSRRLPPVGSAPSVRHPSLLPHQPAPVQPVQHRKPKQVLHNNRVTMVRRPPPPPHPAPVRPQPHRQAPPPPPPPPPNPASSFPSFQFRPKPAAVGREDFYNNVLREVEEYDDFLDQQRDYKERYPRAQVYNPYADLPQGRLPSSNANAHAAPTDDTGYYKPLAGQEPIGVSDHSSPLQPLSQQQQIPPSPSFQQGTTFGQLPQTQQQFGGQQGQFGQQPGQFGQQGGQSGSPLEQMFYQHQQNWNQHMQLTQQHFQNQNGFQQPQQQGFNQGGFPQQQQPQNAGNPLSAIFNLFNFGSSPAQGHAQARAAPLLSLENAGKESESPKGDAPVHGPVQVTPAPPTSATPIPLTMPTHAPFTLPPMMSIPPMASHTFPPMPGMQAVTAMPLVDIHNQQPVQITAAPMTFGGLNLFPMQPLQLPGLPALG